MIIFYLIGLVLLISGTFMLVEALMFRAKARRLKGQVLGFETTEGNKGNYYHPVVHYRDGTKDYLLKTNIGSGSIDYTLNEKVEVLVLGNWHSTARLDAKMYRILGAVIAIVGAVFLAVAITSFRHATYKSLGVLAVMLLTIVGIGIGFFLLKQYRLAKEKKFDYSVHKNGTIGYQPTPDMIMDQSAIISHHTPKGILYLFMGVGIAVLVGSLYWGYHTYTFIEKAVRVPGVIVAQESHYSDGKTMYSAVIEYIPMTQERPIRYTSSYSSNMPSWQVGDDIYVLYDPQNIKDVMEDEGDLNYLFPMAISLFGLVFIGVAALQLKRQRS